MAIDELIDRVRSQIDEETLKKVGAVLEEARAEGKSLSDSLSAANNESKSRKIKLRELEGQFEDKDIEIIGLQKKIEAFDIAPIEQERDNYKERYSNLIKGQKNTFVDFINNVQETPQWDKVKSEYEIPQKDGKPDFESLDGDVLEKNLTRMNYHQQIDYFNVPEHKVNPPTGKIIIDGSVVPTLDEYAELRKQYGPDSPQARQANALIRKSRGY